MLHALDIYRFILRMFFSHKKKMKKKKSREAKQREEK